MSAARHLHPDQLSMFIPAGVLADPAKTEHADLGYTSKTTEHLRGRKIAESKAGSEIGTYYKRADASDVSLHESIKRGGVKKPVALSVYGPTVMDGHHRVFSAADINPKTEVPVEWWD